jgi:hypothetical protein
MGVVYQLLVWRTNMTERKITFTISDEDLHKAGFNTAELSETDKNKIFDSIEIGLKIKLLDLLRSQTTDYWWLPRLTDLRK